MRIILLTYYLLIVGVFSTVAQNINFEWQRTTMYRYPLHPLDKSLKTYSASIQELGSLLQDYHRDSLLDKGLVLPGYEKLKAGGDIQIELVISPLSITNKELKDQPLTNEKDGVKTITHQYWYELKYSFPTKIRLTARGEVVTEQDFPGFYTSDYYPRNRNSQAAIQQEYDNDYHFRNKLLGEKIDERKKEIREWLFSNYGYGLTPRLIDIATIKDKKNEYPDVTKGFSLMMTAFASTDQKRDYLDVEFKQKLGEAISIYEVALQEFSPEKKSRINDKVAAILHYNIALAQYGLHELDAAEQRLTLVKDGTKPTQTAAYRLKEEIQDRRLRLVANGLMEGVLPSEPPKPTKAKEQLTNEAASYRDYIVFVNGDTVEAKFIMPSKEVMPYGDSVWLQDQVIVLEEGKTIEVQAKDIASYSYQGVVRETYSRVEDSSTIPFKMEYKMCKRVETGVISLYECYKVEPSFRDPSQKFVRAYPYYKKGDKFEIAIYGNFNRGVSKLVAEYPELSERVKNGEFMKDDLRKIVREYNEFFEN